jgi:Protein of unknown function (DUF3108)
MRTFCLFLLMLFAVTPALADPAPAGLDVSYSLSFWGIDFGHVQYAATLKSQTYTARAHFETDGAVGFLWKSLIDATAEGALGAHGASPALYDSYSHYRDRPVQRVKISYANGEPSVLFDPIMDLSRFPVSKEQAKDAADPMSALITVLTGAGVTAKAPCGADVQVFDGRRRYAVTFAYVKDEQLDIGHGREAKALCELHFVLIAGYPQRLIMEGREPPKMYADFVAMPEAAAPGGRYIVPVKVWAELGWGTVTATLDTIRLDNAVPALWAAKG